MSGVCILGGQPDYPGHKLGTSPESQVAVTGGSKVGRGLVDTEVAGMGSSSPCSPSNMSLDKVLDRAQSSGKVHLTSRNLKQFPPNANKYKLKDTVVAGKTLTISS